MAKVLYRKYRSKGLNEILGQDHIVQTLDQALKRGATSHAYLFTGPRGVGKTSVARILAHRLNDLPYEHEDNHLDIVEIDAASNRGIDEIRDLREKVHLAPASGRYKVYIIDEVHMLTTPAFNALLKVLEEPPEHVVFILATTESHKLPATIVSRTQRFSFKPIEKSKLVEHLKFIATQEKIRADEEALQLIAEHGEGSFRDSISLLDQAASHGQKISVETVRQLLGVPPTEAIADIINLLGSSNSAELVKHLNGLSEQGYQAAAIAKYLAAELREMLISRQSPIVADDTLALLRDLLDVPASPAPERLLEIILLRRLELANPALNTTSPSTSPIKETSKADDEPSHKQPMPKKTEPAPVAAQPEPSKKNKPVKTAKTGDSTDLWPQLLESVKRDYNTLYGILRMARPEITSNSLILTFKYPFHQKRMQQATQQQIVVEQLEKLSGKKFNLECLLDASLEAPRPIGASQPEAAPEELADLATSAQSSPLETISNIFGGGELLES